MGVAPIVMDKAEENVWLLSEVRANETNPERGRRRATKSSR